MINIHAVMMVIVIFALVWIWSNIMTNREYEAEIARLTQGYEDLKAWVPINKYPDYEATGFICGYVVDSDDLLKEINKITGGEK